MLSIYYSNLRGWRCHRPPPLLKRQSRQCTLHLRLSHRCDVVHSRSPSSTHPFLEGNANLPLLVQVSKIACSISWCLSRWIWVPWGKTSLVLLLLRNKQWIPCCQGKSARLPIILPNYQVSRGCTMCKRQE